jgi:two-component system, sensor histidine kinase YesM
LPKKRRLKPSHSLEHHIKVIVYLSIPIIIINIIVCIYSVVITRQQDVKYISNTITLYQNELARKTIAVEHFVAWTAIHEPLVETIEKTKDYYTRLDAISTFRTRISDNQYSTGKEFQYFLYLKEQDMFLNYSALNITYKDYLIFKKQILKLIEDKKITENSSRWIILKLQNKYYYYYLIDYYNRTFVTLISAEDVLKPLKNVDLGGNGFVVLKNSKGYNLTSTSKDNDTKDYEKNRIFFSHLVFDNGDSRLPYRLHIYVDNMLYERIILIQITVILMAFILAVALYVFLFYLQRKVITPIQNFSLNLSKINESTTMLDLQDSNVIELEQANEQFKNLMRQIVKLKINLYEQELEKKRIQIGFLQQQIKPHFYLNCLTTIYSMAQTQNYKEIESMALFTSEYLRYLFQSNSDYVKLEYELNHINHYLSIQALRYGPAFSYEYEIEPGLEQALIPPLLLMTFMENTIKHCVSLTIKLKISLSISKYTQSDKDYLHILLKDSGPGFPLDVLAALTNLQFTSGENGTHIGISNTIQRLLFLYESDYELNFSNNPDNGACIMLRIPYSI